MVTKLHAVLEDGQISEQFTLFVAGFVPQLRCSPGIFVKGDEVNIIPLSVVTNITDDAVNFVYLDINTLVVTSSTTLPTINYVLIGEATMSSGVITNIEDWRARSEGLVDA